MIFYAYFRMPQVELKSWTASRIGELTQTRESDCLEIAECILGFDDPAVLKETLCRLLRHLNSLLYMIYIYMI